MKEEAALRSQLARQLAHWRAAVVSIDDADNFAATEAWARIEGYLNLTLRKQLQGAVERLRAEVNGLAAQFAAAQSLEQLELAPVSEPRQDSFDIEGERVVQAGDTVYVRGLFPSPPLLAYVDNIPMAVTMHRKPDSLHFEVSLTAPRGTRGGPVRLVWPTRTLVSNQPLWIAGEDFACLLHSRWLTPRNCRRASTVRSAKSGTMPSTPT